MKIKIVSSLVLAGSLATAGLNAQTASLSSGPASSAPQSQPAPAAGQTIYTAHLPTAQELSNAASAQGISIDNIDETAARVTVTYKFRDGQTSVVNYLPVPASNSAPVAPVGPSPQVVTVPSSPPPVVVYQPAPAPRTVYYYDNSPVYYPYPRYVYPPVSLNLGFGFGGYSRGGFHSGGFYHGGFGHRGWR